MKNLYIVRGLPGSGKSTFAKSIAKPWQIFEADQFFMKNGIYTFDMTKLKDAHNDCKRRVHKALHPGLLSSFLYNTVVVSNTFTQDWEMRFYQIIGKKYGYKIHTIIVENRHGGTNQHGVPDEKLDIMRNRFQTKL
jgi:predicted kinase